MTEAKRFSGAVSIPWAAAHATVDATRYTEQQALTELRDAVGIPPSLVQGQPSGLDR